MRRSDQRRDAIFACYQRDITARPLGELLTDAKPFTKVLAEGAAEHTDDLDELIEAHAHGWSIDRIAPLELNIMRVALYEIIHRGDIPDEVSVDEAVTFARRFCGKDTPGFVNAVLAAAAADAGHPLRPREIESIEPEEGEVIEIDADEAARIGVIGEDSKR